MIRSHSASLLLLSFLYACNFNPKPIDIDIPEPEQRLAVSSFAAPPQLLAVTISRTFSALLGEDSLNLEDQDISARVLVDSALVVLRYAGRVDTLSKLAPSLYGSAEALQIPNERYQLYVKDYKTGQEVRAETVLLPTVPLDSVVAIREIFPNLNDTIFTFRFEFDDPAGIENYYLATYTNLDELRDSLGSSVFKFNNATFNVFTDRNSGDGNRIQFKPAIPIAGEGDTLAIALSNIPREYYDFLAAYKRSGNLFSQLVSEPITLPSNIQGGYGYFAMIKPSIRLVVLK